jgi:ribosomal protein L31
MNWCNFFLGVQRLPSIQERVARFEQKFSVYKRG